MDCVGSAGDPIRLTLFSAWGGALCATFCLSWRHGGGRFLLSRHGCPGFGMGTDRGHWGDYSVGISQKGFAGDGRVAAFVAYWDSGYFSLDCLDGIGGSEDGVLQHHLCAAMGLDQQRRGGCGNAGGPLAGSSWRATGKGATLCAGRKPFRGAGRGAFWAWYGSCGGTVERQCGGAKDRFSGWWRARAPSGGVY